MQRNMIGWFEIPVADMERAMAFYEKVFGVKLSRNTMGPLDMAWFPFLEKAEGAAGSLVRHPDHYKPSSDGTLVYFSSAADDLSVELGRVGDAGGKVLMEKKEIAPDIGFMALFLDTEGNRLALHSRK
jgi:predicted enzyme related to lactoylglutathione lyase